MTDAVRRVVRTRASSRCEYCLLPEALVVLPFEMEHVIPIQHGGTDALGNLAYACLHCNRHKGPNLAGIDPITSRTKLVRLFNPRRHVWAFHFVWEGSTLAGRTAIGRVTGHVLNMNAGLMVTLRDELIEEGLFPPDV